jgi:hypothetical protein
MPVSDEGAALQFFVEAMKANTAALEQVSRTMRGMQDEQKETLKLVHDTRERVIKIESASVNTDISQLKRDVEDLKKVNYKRDGADNLASGILRNGPSVLTIIGFIILAMVVLAANGKITL